MSRLRGKKESTGCLYAIFLIIAIIFLEVLFSCGVNTPMENKLSRLKSPVTIIGLECQDYTSSWDGTRDTTRREKRCGVVIKDADGSVLILDHLSSIGNMLGSSRKIGDTIK